MAQAPVLAKALNTLTKSAQLNYSKARAAARTDGNVDWAKTKAYNDDFNPEVDGCESFVMNDGSVCAWIAARQSFAAR